MSQQEFVPRSQSNGQDALNDEDEIVQPHYPYHWSGKLNKEGGPRDEPPSSYAEPTMQRGYQAQDYTSTPKQQNSTPNSAGQQWSGNQNRGPRRQFSPDGDAFEHAVQHAFGGQLGQLVELRHLFTHSRFLVRAAAFVPATGEGAVVRRR